MSNYFCISNKVGIAFGLAIVIVCFGHAVEAGIQQLSHHGQQYTERNVWHFGSVLNSLLTKADILRRLFQQEKMTLGHVLWKD